MYSVPSVVPILARRLQRRALGRLLHAPGPAQAEHAERHAHRVEREGAPQRAESLAPRALGEDPSHDGDDSDEAKDEQQVAGNSPKHISLLAPGRATRQGP